VPLINLRDHLTHGIATLDEIAVKLNTAPGLQLPVRVQALFEEATKKSEHLSNAVQMLEVREATNGILGAFRQQMRQSAPTYRIHNVDVNFPVARLMLFQNVVCSNWALYDTIAGACGVMCMTDPMLKPNQKPPNFINFGQDKHVAARTHEYVKAIFGWDLSLCYEIRNWVVHSGENDASFKLFRYQHSSIAGFEIENDSWAELVSGAQRRFSMSTPDTVDLTLLKNDSAQTFLDSCLTVDRLASYLISYSVGSLRLQVDLLCS
jgi:hypothetical protein